MVLNYLVWAMETKRVHWNNSGPKILRLKSYKKKTKRDWEVNICNLKNILTLASCLCHNELILD